jgi:hypothetical protein
LTQAGHAVTPLDAMLMVLKARLERGDENGILAAAAAAAPYCHARLAQSDVTVRHCLADMSDADLVAEIEQLRQMQQQVAAARALPVPKVIEAAVEEPTAGDAEVWQTVPLFPGETI